MTANYAFNKKKKNIEEKEKTVHNTRKSKTLYSS